ncbi:hypothetical protein vseg_018309 [Gypsophila vaccaria]
MSQLKAVADELAMLGDPVKDEDFQDYILGGIDGSRYAGFIESVQYGRDTTMSYPELLEKLINLEHLLDNVAPTPSTSYPATVCSQRHQPYKKHHSGPHNQSPNNYFKGKCQWCYVVGHTLFYCPVLKDLYPDILVSRHPRPQKSNSAPAVSHKPSVTAHSRPQVNNTIPRSIVPSSWPLEPSQSVTSSS